MAAPELVFATRRAPWPLDNGARIRSHQLVRGLGAAFATRLVYLDHPPGSPDGHVAAEAVRDSLPGVEVVTVPRPAASKRVDQLWRLVQGGSFGAGRYADRPVRDALARAVADDATLLLHCDDLGMALAGPCAGVVNVYSSHNVEQRIVGQAAASGPALRRVYNGVEARRLAAEEARVWAAMDLCLAVSAGDAATMRAGGARRVEVCPNGTDPVDPLPAPVREPGRPLQVLFVGSGDYLPYERGLAWFVGEVLPRLDDRLPVAFDVVGTPPRRPVHRPGVRYVGRVASVAPWYAAADVVVVPVFEGSGTRLKVVEALAHRRPVVSTALGAEGLGLRPDEHYLEAEDAGAFAAALTRLGQGEVDLEPMLDAGRVAAEPLFWPNVVAGLVGLYRSVMDDALIGPAG